MDQRAWVRQTVAGFVATIGAGAFSAVWCLIILWWHGVPRPWEVVAFPWLVFTGCVAIIDVYLPVLPHHAPGLMDRLAQIVYVGAALGLALAAGVFVGHGFAL